MAEIIKMPKMSDTMTEGVIAVWHKKIGDQIKSGDILAEVETDKATMDLEAYDDGTLLHIGAKKGEAVPVDGLLAVIGEKGENISALIDQPSSEMPNSEEKSVENTKDQPKEEQNIDTSDIKAVIIRMPKMSDTMTEGVISSWLKKEGDSVKSGDILAEVETDKATMELEAYDDGILLYKGVEDGGSVAVDGVLAVIGEKGADFQKLIDAEKQASAKSPKSETVSKSENITSAAPDTVATKTENKIPAEPVVSTGTGERVKASPLAKRLAKEKGLNLSGVKGSGENGRIIKRDIEQAAAGGIYAPSQGVSKESFTEVPISQMRKTIARRLAESKFGAPHFYLTMEIDMDKAVEMRKDLIEALPVKVSFNDMVIKASALALREHPAVNSAWLGDKIRYNEHIHIGMAVAVEEGLLVPVIRFADSKPLAAIAAEAKTLGQKAKNKELQPTEWEGNTFTISNLGMLGIEEFTAIINPPDACILAVGGIKQIPVVKDGTIVIGNVMKVTMSCDHRVVDGATGSAFLQTLKTILESPVKLFI